jgi:hypothetical protein
MKKVIENGNVAVLYSPSYGAGWYTWNSSRSEDDKDALELIFDPALVELVQKKNSPDCINETGFIHLIERRAHEISPMGYFAGAHTLDIEWIPIGTEFRIHEYDGYESIDYKEKIDWIKA